MQFALPLPMNRQPRAYNLLLHMQQKIVSPGSGVQSAILVSENSHPNPVRQGEGEEFAKGSEVTHW